MAIHEQSPNFRLRALALGVLAAVYGGRVLAGPEGGSIVDGSGTGTITQPSDDTTLITQTSNRLAIDWQSFDVAEGETVSFEQPSVDAAVLNRIFDQNPSQILGALQANGRVYLVNPNGIVFGESASIDVGALIASSLELALDDFAAGVYEFEATDGAGGAIVNRGLITAATGGSVTLLGGSVANEGLIVAELGQVNLGAGSSASLDFDGDGLLFFEVDGAVLENAAGVAAAVDNAGEIRADGGEVLLTASAAQDVFSSVVNQRGTIRAARIDDSDGVVRLLGAGGDVVTSGTIDASSQIDVGATGDVTLAGSLAADDRIEVRIDTDNDESAVLRLSGVLTADNVLLSGSVDADDTLVKTGAGSNDWLVTAAGTGVLNGQQLFSGFENLTGGGGSDTFSLVGPLAGTASGGAGNDTFVVFGSGGAAAYAGGTGSDTLSYAASDIARTIAVDSLDGIELLTGSSSPNDVLRGTAGGDTFVTSGGNSGTVNEALAYSSFETLEGLGGDDTFTLRHNVDGGADGGAGSDTFDVGVGIAIGALHGGAGGSDDDRLVLGSGPAAFTLSAPDTGTANGLAFDDIEHLEGSANADTFDLAFDLSGVASGLGGDDMFNLGAGAGAHVSGGAGADTITADPAQAATFNVTAPNAGTIANGGDVVTFDTVENLTGSAGNDAFHLDASLDGTAAGGAGDDDFFAAVNVSGSVAGNDGADRLFASDSGATFTVSSLNAGSLVQGAGAVTFAALESLIGGDAIDRFVVDADLTGTAWGGGGDDVFALGANASVNVSGEGGADVLAAAPGIATVFSIDGPNEGSAANGSGTVTFTSTENLHGSEQADTFVFDAALGGTALGLGGDDTFVLNDGGSAGVIDGGSGADTQSHAGVSGAVTVGTAGLMSIERLVGSADSGDTLHGTAGDDTFVTTGVDEGTVEGIAYSGFENLAGLGGADTFLLGHDVTGSAGVDGGAGDDVFSMSAGATMRITGGSGIDGFVADVQQATRFDVATPDAGTAESGNGTVTFASVEHLTGSGRADTFNLNAALSGGAAGAAGADVFNVAVHAGGALAGGAGNDVFNLTQAASATIDGGEGADTLAADAAASAAFDVDADNAGTLTQGAGTVSFSTIEHLTGSGQDDTFRLGALLDGTAAGGAGDDLFFVDAIVGAAIDGGVGRDVLQGPDGAASYTVNGTDAGSAAAAAGTVVFAGIEQLLAGAGDDTFAMLADFAGSIAAGPGDDLFDVAVGIATVLAGGEGADAYRIADGAVATGVLDGGAGRDTLDFSSHATPRHATLAASGTGGGFDGSEASAADFRGIEALIAGEAGDDALTGTGADATWQLGGGGGRYADGAGSLDFAGFERLSGGAGADRFVLGDGMHAGDLNLAGNAGDDAADIAGNLVVGGDLAFTAIETIRVTAADAASAVIEAAAWTIDGASGGIGAAGAPVHARIDTLEVTNSDTGLFVTDLSGGLRVEGAMIGLGDIELVVTEGDLIVGLVDAGGSGAPRTPPAAGTGGDVVLVAAGGSIGNGNGSEVNVRGRTATLRALLNIGSTASPVTIVIPSSETITLASGIDASIDNISLATVDDLLVAGIVTDTTANATAAAVGASTVTSLQDVATIDWAALDPNVALVDCLAPCTRLPADQLEDDGFAELRDAEKRVLIRVADGWKMIPVFERQPFAAAY